VWGLGIRKKSVGSRPPPREFKGACNVREAGRGGARTPSSD
jgi:hypothetical protein